MHQHHGKEDQGAVPGVLELETCRLPRAQRLVRRDALLGLHARLLVERNGDALRGGILPVVSPVASDASGRPVNVNADEAALGLARALGAATLVYLSDVDGVRLDEETATTLAPEAAARRIDDGTIAGGMALKVRVALEASAAGIPEVVIAGKARLLGTFPGTRLLTGAAAGASEVTR